MIHYSTTSVNVCFFASILQEQKLTFLADLDSGVRTALTSFDRSIPKLSSPQLLVLRGMMPPERKHARTNICGHVSCCNGLGTLGPVLKTSQSWSHFNSKCCRYGGVGHGAWPFRTGTYWYSISSTSFPNLLYMTEMKLKHLQSVRVCFQERSVYVWST